MCFIPSSFSLWNLIRKPVFPPNDEHIKCFEDMIGFPRLIITLLQKMESSDETSRGVIWNHLNLLCNWSGKRSTLVNEYILMWYSTHGWPLCPHSEIEMLWKCSIILCYNLLKWMVPSKPKYNSIYYYNNHIAIQIIQVKISKVQSLIGQVSERSWSCRIKIYRYS